MKESEIRTGDQGAPEQEKEVLTVKHDDKNFIFSHVNNQFFPTFAFLKEEGTDNIVTVDWKSLAEDTRTTITDYLKQSKEKEVKAYTYDHELYLTLLNAPSNVKQALKEQAQRTASFSAGLGSLSRHIDKRDEEPANLLEEVARGIATAKKKGEEYGRTFAPDKVNLILEWLETLDLSPQKSGDRISVDFSDQKK